MTSEDKAIKILTQQISNNHSIHRKIMEEESRSFNGYFLASKRYEEELFKKYFIVGRSSERFSTELKLVERYFMEKRSVALYK